VVIHGNDALFVTCYKDMVTTLYLWRTTKTW